MPRTGRGSLPILNPPVTVVVVVVAEHLPASLAIYPLLEWSGQAGCLRCSDRCRRDGIEHADVLSGPRLLRTGITLLRERLRSFIPPEHPGSWHHRPRLPSPHGNMARHGIPVGSPLRTQIPRRSGVAMAIAAAEIAARVLNGIGSSSGDITTATYPIVNHIPGPVRGTIQPSPSGFARNQYFLARPFEAVIGFEGRRRRSRGHQG